MDSLAKSFVREVDDDGRFLIPEELLDEYQTIIFNMGFGTYLHLQNDQAWLEFENALSQADILNVELADLTDRFRSTQERVERDAEGRVKIPERLRQLAHIGRFIICTPIQLTTVAYYRVWDKELKERGLNPEQIYQ